MILSYFAIPVLAIIISVVIYFSTVLQFYVKLIACGLSLLLITTFAIPFCLFRFRSLTNYKFAKLGGYALSLITGITCHVNGQENLLKNKPFIIVANHQSVVDLIGMFGSDIWPDRCTVIAKKSLLFLTGPLGLFGWLSGVIYIDRLNPSSSRGTMSHAAQLINDNNITVWVFPEGTRNMDEIMLPFKKGAFHLAVNAQVPVVPIVFASYKHLFDSTRQVLSPGKFSISILPPVPTTGLDGSDVTSLATNIRDQMTEEIKRISLPKNIAALNQ